MSSIFLRDSGIYKITNMETGDFYVGSALSISSRWKKHMACLRGNTHINKKLQNSYNKYGNKAFFYSVVEFCEREILIEREQKFFDSLAPTFNVCKQAGSTLGIKLSEDVKNGISKRMLGKKIRLGAKHSEETKMLLSQTMSGKKNHLGKKHSLETRSLFSKQRKGRSLSLEWRRKIGLSHKGLKHSKKS